MARSSLRMKLKLFPVSPRQIDLKILEDSINALLQTNVKVGRIDVITAEGETGIAIWYEEGDASEVNKLLNLRVDELELGCKVFYTLQNLDIETVKQMHEWFQHGQFPKGFGKKSQAEVREKLIALSLI